MHYYLHIVTDAELLRDPEGAEFADFAAAQSEAFKSARDLIADELKRGHQIPLGWRMLVASADDTVLMPLPFSAAVGSSSPGSGVSRPRPKHVHTHDSGVSVQNEHHRLAEMDQHIDRGRHHIEAQKTRICILESDGRETKLAKELLAHLEKTYQCMLDRRELILRQIARLAHIQTES